MLNARNLCATFYMSREACAVDQGVLYMGREWELYPTVTFDTKITERKSTHYIFKKRIKKLATFSEKGGSNSGCKTIWLV